MLLMIPMVSSAQEYFDLGGKIGKFNSGVTAQYALGGVRSKNVHPWGFEAFAGRSEVAKGGILFGLYGFKEWEIKDIITGTPDNLFFRISAGPQFGIYKDYYNPLANMQGIVYYPKQWTTTIGAAASIGLEYIDSTYPVTVGLSCSPWWDITNPGPEFIDFSISVRYQIAGLF